MSKLSREFFRQIGAKGGRNGKWSSAKRNSAQRAAQIRWSRYRAQEKALADYQRNTW